MGRILLSSLIGVLGVCLVGSGVYWFFMVRTANAEPRAVVADPAKPEAVRRLSADTLQIPGDVSTSIGLQFAEVKKATRPRSLPPLPGYLNLDSDRMPRLRSRFAGEIVALGTTQGEETTESKEDSSSSGRPLRWGDRFARISCWRSSGQDLGERKANGSTPSQAQPGSRHLRI